jgi:hypothetical protein
MKIGDLSSNTIDSRLLQHVLLIFVHALHKRWVTEFSPLTALLA